MKGLEIKNIKKTFGRTKALDNVSLVLPAGKIYGLLGRNGAGKSTLLHIATTPVCRPRCDFYRRGNGGRK